MALMLNEDYERFTSRNPLEKMDEQGLSEWIDLYFQGGVTQVFFCVNAQRAYYDSQVFEPIWHDIVKGEDGKYFHRGEEVLNTPLPTLANALGAKALQENTGNPFQTRIDLCRKKGGAGGLSVRMNDCHLGGYPDSPMHSRLWSDHPQWYLKTTGLDYAVAEFRSRMLAFIEELFARFDMDALELDWMRTPPFFREGQEDENRHWLDEMVRQIFEMKCQAEKRLGHKILLQVRVPTRPDEALRLGLDVVKWAKEGWIDTVIACAFICSTDNAVPLEIWDRLLPENIRVIPGIDILTTSHDGVMGIEEETRINEIIWGYAASFYHRGAEDIYLFNHYPLRKTPEIYREKLYNLSLRELAEKAPRRHVATMCCNLVPGIASASSLPLKAMDSWQSVRIETGGMLKDREVTLLFAFEADADADLETFEFTVNEIPCPVCKRPFPYAVPDPSWKKILCSVPENVLKGGSAVLSFRAKHPCKAVLHWCEVDVAAAP